ncbi:MAG: hypothetical protein J6A38_03520 [Clostridia bacterium]|nr:hypothetical protein [Clostridia bacterium]
MKKYKIKTVPNKQSVYLKKRIAKTRSRAKLVGLLYLFATMALAAAACLPLLDIGTLSQLQATKFYKVFKGIKLEHLKTARGVYVYVPYVLYGLLLFVLAINVLKALSKLNWLFKKKASKTYGFNRNVYAMEDLSRIFSGSFAVIILMNFVICVLAGLPVKSLEFANVKWLVFVIAGGLAVHFLCGLWGGKASLFVVHEGVGIVEQKRDCGRFAPFIRNLLQVGASFAMLYFFLRGTTLAGCIDALMEKSAIKEYVLHKDTMLYFIASAVQVLMIVWLMVLVKHATASTEYGIEGRHADGMMNFRVFSFFTFLSVIGVLACRYLFGEANFFFGVWSPLEKLSSSEKWFELLKETSLDFLIIGAIAFGMFIIELIMHGAPRTNEEKMLKKAGIKTTMDVSGAEQMKPAVMVGDEMELDDFLSANYNPNYPTGQPNGYPQRNTMEYNY